MDFNTLLEKRRSIRKYQPGGEVSREMVEELIQAAIQAPSWKNSQTARYYAVTSPEMLKEIKETCLPPYNANNSKNAPVLLVTTFVHNISGFNADGTPTNEGGNLWGAYDLGLHNELLLLKAAELGLGTLIMGLRDSQHLKELLSIPDTETVMSVIALGVPDIEPQKPKRKTVEEIAKFF